MGWLFVSDDEPAAEYDPEWGQFLTGGTSIAQSVLGRTSGLSRTTGSPSLPVVQCDTLVHHRFKTGVLLDEDLAECPILPQKNGLKAH